ncbi:MAG: NAAT family transporter [Neisseriaceae bacterium]|nr:NAAT family transporter [Neisseriaceae bacterium]MBP6861706.1 NAAT family transporter [Neisseriaceae bacterium]
MSLEIIKILVALIVLMNPLGAIPLFLNLTADNSAQERQAIAKVAAIAVAIGILIFALFGNGLLKALNISIGSFQIGGGILVLLIAISMMNPKSSNTTEATKEEHKEAKDKENISVVPLAIPLLFGPGAISTVIIYSSTANGFWEMAQLCLAGIIAAFVCYLAMVSATPLRRLLGKTGINIIGRVMGLILAAVSIEIIVNGLKNVFPQLM